MNKRETYLSLSDVDAGGHENASKGGNLLTL